MTNAEIEARLAAIRERCEEAKGPWIFRDNITERVEFFCQFARTEMPWLLEQLAEAKAQLAGAEAAMRMLAKRAGMTLSNVDEIWAAMEQDKETKT